MLSFFKSKPKSYEDLNASEFANGIKEKEAVIIDVRTKGEFESGKIKDSRNLDVMSPGFSEYIKNLPKDKAYYLYCRSGNRSGQACKIMAKEGFGKIYNLSGGLMHWPHETV